MSSMAHRFPRPDPSDTEDVLFALETAQALYSKGELQDAVRWLRRAADEAEQAGSDQRALELARAAAELVSEVSPPVSSPKPPPVSSPNPGISAAAATSVAPAETPSVGAGRPRLPPPPPKRSSLPAPLASETLPPPTGVRTGVATQEASVADGASASAASLPSTQSQKAPSVRSDSEVRRAPEPTPSDIAKLAAERRLVRVWAKRSVRDDTLMVVRKIEPGKPIPVGAHEAFLLLDPESDWLDDQPDKSKDPE